MLKRAGHLNRFQFGLTVSPNFHHFFFSLRTVVLSEHTDLKEITAEISSLGIMMSLLTDRLSFVPAALTGLKAPAIADHEDN